ncbi:MAG: CocE/NonD family hydrolase [Rhodospirillales bacterium]|jgi:hypothetical protein|nr:CocE/NonD family hydrolase [Rhodospirillales bacterium]MDP6646723.1 CocE/NonD family hydrolase [Rhodospirillales bacterium]MDP6840580.1 CocE/NonD family hydrolase [Rhodospirillales bacterium]
MSGKNDWHDLVSQPEYEMVLEEDVWVNMRDGVRLCVDIYRPKAEGKFPGLLSLSAYGKAAQKVPTNPVFQTSDYIIGSGGHECGEQNYFVPRGYVHVIPDVRGVGRSEGEFTADLSQDGHDLIQWMGEEDWCNGNVGMMGMSAFAISQFKVAAEHPSHLKAFAPFEGLTDWYRHHYYHGGILNYLFTNSFARLHPIRRHGKPAYPSLFSEDELRAKVEELQKNPDILCLPYLYMATEAPEMNPVVFELMLHPHDCDYYQKQSPHAKLGSIEIPALLGSRWNGAPIHLPGAIDALENLGTPRDDMKFIMAPSDHYGGMDRPFHEIQDIVLRFYDHWLKGNDTGMMDEPTFLFFIPGINTWRQESEFPLAETKWKKFYLREDAKLSLDAPQSGEQPQIFESNPWANPMEGFGRADILAKADPVPKVIYEYGPLAENMEITGPLALYWNAAIESRGVLTNNPRSPEPTVLEPVSNDTDWYLEIYDIDVDGAERCVAEGWLKASHYELDEAKSKPYHPHHPHTRSLPIEPGEVILYASDLRVMSNVFLMGHKIRLEISAQDQVRALWFHVPHMAHVTHTIFSTAEKPSYLLLPVIPKGHQGAGEPDVLPLGPFRIPKFRRPD